MLRNLMGFSSYEPISSLSLLYEEKQSIGGRDIFSHYTFFTNRFHPAALQKISFFSAGQVIKYRQQQFLYEKQFR